jgi:hypothetical protein
MSLGITSFLTDEENDRPGRCGRPLRRWEVYHKANQAGINLLKRMIQLALHHPPAAKPISYYSRRRFPFVLSVAIIMGKHYHRMAVNEEGFEVGLSSVNQALRRQP